MVKTRIAVIGAGSVAWSMTFVKDLAVTKSLSGSEVVFMDISRERLELAHNLATRYVNELGANVEFSVTTDRKEAIKDADFVINMAFTVGYGNMERERRIAEKHGYYRGIGDRVCDYYGSLGAYKQLKFFLDVAHDIERLAPDSWCIILANPVFEGTTLVARESDVNVVGMCHGWLGYKQVSEFLDLDPKHVDFLVVGTNHNVWLSEFTHGGKDAYPLLYEWIRERASEYWRSDEYLNPLHPWESEQMSPAAVEMYRLYDLFPLGDTIRAASPWWFHTDLETKRRWYGPAGGFDSEIGWSAYLAYHDMQLRRMETMAGNREASMLQEFPPIRSDEQIIPLINAVANDEETRVVINILNGSAVSGIAGDVAVEILVLASAKGVKPQKTEAKLPSKLMLHVMTPRILVMEGLLQAYVEGDRMGLLLILMEDPRTHSFEQAKAAVDEILSQPWNSEAKQHYK